MRVAAAGPLGPSEAQLARVSRPVHGSCNCWPDLGSRVAAGTHEAHPRGQREQDQGRAQLRDFPAARPRLPGPVGAVLPGPGRKQGLRGGAALPRAGRRAKEAREAGPGSARSRCAPWRGHPEPPPAGGHFPDGAALFSRTIGAPPLAAIFLGGHLRGSQAAFSPALPLGFSH